MSPSISVITLGVVDMARAFRFYRDGLGLPSRSKNSDKVIYFDLAGTKLALYPIYKLARDISSSIPWEKGIFSGITLSHNVNSEREVMQLLDQAQQAGGVILKPAQATDWGGYHGYFADPDGHHWEVVFNPKKSISPEGLLP